MRLGLLSWLLTESQPAELAAGLVLITAQGFYSVYRTTLKIFPFPDALPSLTFLWQGCQAQCHPVHHTAFCNYSSDRFSTDDISVSARGRFLPAPLSEGRAVLLEDAAPRFWPSQAWEMDKEGWKGAFCCSLHPRSGSVQQQPNTGVDLIPDLCTLQLPFWFFLSLLTSLSSFSPFLQIQVICHQKQQVNTLRVTVSSCNQSWAGCSFCSVTQTPSVLRKGWKMCDWAKKRSNSLKCASCLQNEKPHQAHVVSDSLHTESKPTQTSWHGPSAHDITPITEIPSLEVLLI